MTADGSSSCMPTGPYRQPDKMDIYMNFTKNGNQVWGFCKPKSKSVNMVNNGGNGVGGRFLGTLKKAMSSQSISGEPETSRTCRRREEEEKETTNKPLMNEQNQNSDTNGGPKFQQPTMMKDVEDLNLTNRDPINMTSHVRIGFEEVFAEPDHQQSFDAVWTTSFIVYTQSKMWCYRLLSAALAIPLALLWGVQLAFLTFCHIWWVVPCSRVWIFILNWVGSLWATFIRALCNPITESCSMLLGNVKVHMHPPQHHV